MGTTSPKKQPNFVLHQQIKGSKMAPIETVLQQNIEALDEVVSVQMSRVKVNKIKYNSMIEKAHDNRQENEKEEISSTLALYKIDENENVYHTRKKNKKIKRHKYSGDFLTHELNLGDLVEIQEMKIGKNPTSGAIQKVTLRPIINKKQQNIEAYHRLRNINI